MRRVPDKHPSGESHWQSVMLPFKIGTGRTLYSEDREDERLQLSFFYSTETKQLEAFVWFGEMTQGPPEHVHGGVMCYIMDEAMGTHCWAAGHPVVAGQLSFSFLKMVRVNALAKVVSKLESTEGSKVHVSAEVIQDDILTTKGSATFVRLREEQVRALSKNHPQLNLNWKGLKWRKIDSTSS